MRLTKKNRQLRRRAAQLKRLRETWRLRALHLALLDTECYKAVIDYATTSLGAWGAFQRAFDLLKVPYKDQNVRLLCAAVLSLQKVEDDTGF